MYVLVYINSKHVCTFENYLNEDGLKSRIEKEDKELPMAQRPPLPDVTFKWYHFLKTFNLIVFYAKKL